MSEPSPVYTFVWWSLLLASLIMILREMRKWLKLRTVSVDAWIDTPRIQLPDDEVKGLAERLKSLSESKAKFFTIGLVVSDILVDRLSLTLGLSIEELSNSLRDGDFVKKSFGPHVSIVDFLSREWKGHQLAARNERKTPRNVGAQTRQFDEINTLLDQEKRWEKEYESSRGF